jgi:ubiquinone/menaquinone biosynthesis C-methylase UbiE
MPTLPQAVDALRFEGETMERREADRVFGATIAEVYESHLVPLLFEPYAAIAAERVAELRPRRILEIAAGTGVLTRALSARMPEAVEIVASDLNQAMLDRAMAAGTARTVQWRQADALALPFADATVDAVVCQFGAMFFPDKPRAFAEARRVLASGGTFLFSVWDRLDENEFADAVNAAMAARYPEDPPSLFRRVPHGYFDRAAIAADLRAAGFAEPANFVTIAARSRANSPLAVAVALCEGTPLRTEIEARSNGDVAATTHYVADALARRFGEATVDGKMQAHLVSVGR